MSTIIEIRPVADYPDMYAVMYMDGLDGLFRGLFRLAIPILKRGFGIAKPHLKSAPKNIAADVVSNALSRSYNDNSKAQDGSGLIFMARKRLFKPPGMRRCGHSIKKQSVVPRRPQSHV